MAQKCDQYMNACVNLIRTIMLLDLKIVINSMKIARLERELKRQTDLQAIYRAKLERMHEYHRACLQIAQKNGFLDIITKSHELSSTLFGDFMLKTSPRQQPATTCNPNLADIADQAKLNGWYIEPNEVCNLVIFHSTNMK